MNDEQTQRLIAGAIIGVAAPLIWCAIGQFFADDEEGRQSTLFSVGKACGRLVRRVQRSFRKNPQQARRHPL